MLQIINAGDTVQLKPFVVAEIYTDMLGGIHVLSVDRTTYPASRIVDFNDATKVGDTVHLKPFQVLSNVDGWLKDCFGWEHSAADCSIVDDED